MGFLITKSIEGAVACEEVELVRSYFSVFVDAGRSLRLVKTIGVTSVILLPRKTVISLAAISSLQGSMPCFITLTLTPLNRTLTLVTKLTLPTEIIRHHQLNSVSKFFGLQHDWCDTEFF